MEDEETYTMEFECSNCGHTNNVKIDRGKSAKGAGGVCPYCGTCDYGSFSYRRPWATRQAEAMRGV